MPCFSKCYRQLGELKNLRESGLISEDEYARERECIMGTLKTLLEVASKFFFVHNYTTLTIISYTIIMVTNTST